MHRTKMADHFVETPEWEKCKKLCLVCLKVTESAKIMTFEYKYIFKIFWARTPRPLTTFTPPPLNKIPGSAPGALPLQVCTRKNTDSRHAVRQYKLIVTI